MNRLTFFLGFALITLAVVLVGIYNPVQPAAASVSRSGEYHATTTAGSAVFGAAYTGASTVYTGRGTLGSVVITGANTGIMNFYDATTTDVNKRTNNVASSTILIASFPASTAAGTYTIDATFFTALLLDNYATGVMPTTTITWREN